MVGSPPAVALTVGVFDGVHRGHQALVEKMVARAKADRLNSVCITFDPDPEIVLHPDRPHLALSTISDRREHLLRMGVEHVEVVAFTREVSLQTPEQFIDSVRDRYELRALWVGSDFALGRERTGTVDALQRIGKRLGFAVFVVEPLRHNDRPISSTWIREALHDGDMSLTRELLGRSYCVEGEVVSGARRGRQLGFPTANIIPPAGRALPGDGVYFVHVSFLAKGGRGTGAVAGETETRKATPDPARPLGAPARQADAALRYTPPAPQPCYGVVNLGARPTFDETERVLETHLLDFDEDIYSTRLHVCFLQQLRPIRPFPSISELSAQIARDVGAARDLMRSQLETPGPAHDP